LIKGERESEQRHGNREEYHQINREKDVKNKDGSSSSQKINELFES